MDLNLQIRRSNIIVCNLLVATMLLILSVPWSVYPDPHSQRRWCGSSMGSKSNKTGRQVSVVGWHVWKDGGDNRWTREAVRKPETSGSGPASTVRLAGSRLQRRSCLCPQTAVHPVIGDGSKLLWSKIFNQRQGAMDWQVVSGQIATAVHYGWEKKLHHSLLA